MNRAIIAKTVRETLPMLTIVFGAIVLLETLLVCVFGEFTDELQYLLRHPLFQRIVRMLTGADFGPDLTATTFMSFGFAHPVMFAVTWAFVLTVCTRVIVGEIERGTADLLLTLPVSRVLIYVHTSLVWILAGALLSAAPLLGVWIGQNVSPMWQPLDFSLLSMLPVNLYALYLCIGSITVCISSFATHRGQVIFGVIAWLLASFLLNFLEQFWPTVEKFNFIGVLRYYRPLPVIRSGEWPVLNIIVLGVAAVVFWTIGMWRYSRRDIPST